MAELTGQLFAGRYQIEQQLGQGGMGTVYLATQRGLGRKVAVKVLNANISSNAEQQRRFESEARLSASLTHPHIVSIFDYGIENGVNYVAMPFITGGTLSQRYASIEQSQNPLPALRETSTVISQIASALDYAHSRGIIHRDVKPSNIMFDEQGNAFLTDFGIARLIAATTSFTMTGAQIGTPMYMPPEQWEGRGNLSQATDQYALAVMTFQLITGELPFKADTITAMMHAHIYETPATLQVYRPDLPQAITDVIHKALSKNQDNRYPSTIEFANAFDNAIQGLHTEGSTLFFQTLVQIEPRDTPFDESILITQPIQHSNKAKSRNRYSSLILIGVILLIGGVLFAMISTTQQNEDPQQAIIILETDTPQADNINPEPLQQTIDASINETTTASLWTATSTNTPTPTLTMTVTPQPTDTMTVTPQPTPTMTFTPQPTDTPVGLNYENAINQAYSFTGGNLDWSPIIASFNNDRIQTEMVLVPAGVFEMGSTDEEVTNALVLCNQIDKNSDCYLGWFSDEAPKVSTEIRTPFWLDRYEISNADFVTFLNEKGNVSVEGYEYLDSDDDDRQIFQSNGSWFVEADLGSHPAMEITWFAARDFCVWRGDNFALPTEPHWEYAAKGRSDWTYPWGNNFGSSNANHCDLNCSQASWAGNLRWKQPENNDGYQHTSPVTTYPQGSSWVGAYNMAGNVSEWVSSLHRSYPYVTELAEDPNNFSDYRVIRGGAFDFGAESLRTSERSLTIPDDSNDSFGFRCMRTIDIQPGQATIQDTSS